MHAVMSVRQASTLLFMC